MSEHRLKSWVLPLVFALSAVLIVVMILSCVAFRKPPASVDEEGESVEADSPTNGLISNATPRNVQQARVKARPKSMFGPPAIHKPAHTPVEINALKHEPKSADLPRGEELITTTTATTQPLPEAAPAFQTTPPVKTVLPVITTSPVMPTPPMKPITPVKMIPVKIAPEVSPRLSRVGPSIPELVAHEADAQEAGGGRTSASGTTRVKAVVAQINKQGFGSVKNDQKQ